MQHLLDSLYSKNKYYVDDVLINLDFKAKGGVKKEAFLEEINFPIDFFTSAKTDENVEAIFNQLGLNFLNNS